MYLEKLCKSQCRNQNAILKMIFVTFFYFHENVSLEFFYIAFWEEKQFFCLKFFELKSELDEIENQFLKYATLATRVALVAWLCPTFKIILRDLKNKCTKFHDFIAKNTPTFLQWISLLSPPPLQAKNQKYNFSTVFFGF